MNSSEIQLDVFVSDSDSDAERLDELTIRFMRDLREIGAESVERPAREAAPEGAKGEPFAIGALILAAVPAVLPKIVEYLQAWSLRGEGRQVRIKTPAGLEVEFTPENRMSEEELLALADKLIRVRASDSAA